MGITDRSSTRNMVKEITKIDASVGRTMTSSMEIGAKVPLEVVSLEAKDSYVLQDSMKAAFSYSLETSSDTLVEKSIVRTEKRTFEGPTDKEGMMQYIYLCSYRLGGTVIKSFTVIAFDEEGRKLADKATTATIKITVDQEKYFYIQNDNGHFFAAPGNDSHPGRRVTVWDKKL